MLGRLLLVLLWSVLLASCVVVGGKSVKITWSMAVEPAKNDALRAVERSPYGEVKTVLMRFPDYPELFVSVKKPGTCMTFLTEEALDTFTSISFLSPSGEVLLAEPRESFVQEDCGDVIKLRLVSFMGNMSSLRFAAPKGYLPKSRIEQ